MNYDIIFPFYRDFEYLEKSLMQISKQSILPKNLIFIDDGNNFHNLKELLFNNLNDKINLIYIQNFTNKGSNESINKGLKKIISPYFYINAADDIIYKNFAEENLKILSENPKYPFVFSNIIINNEKIKKKYFLNYRFLKKKKYISNEVKKIFAKHQFKIYHNTVFFKSDIFLNYNIFKPEYGVRSDMLNLYYISFKYGFLYLDKNISEFTIRSGQQGEQQNDNYLLNELLFIKKMNNFFYKDYIKSNLHYDFSPLAIFHFISNNLYESLTMKWFIRSIKFRLWKKIRFILPNFLLKFLFNIFN
jgi:hypothetical protein